MSEMCEAQHPETGQRCYCEGFHPQHLAGLGRDRVSWDNDEAKDRIEALKVKKSPKTPAQEALSTLRSIASRATPEHRVGR